MIKFLRGILAGAKIVGIKSLKFRKTSYPDFVSWLNPGAIILTRERNPKFWQRVVQGFAKSPWQHVAIYVGVIDKKDCFEEHGIIEADEPKVKLSSLDDYFSVRVQMKAWQRKLTKPEISDILKRAFALVRSDYDIGEFFSTGLPFFSDDPNRVTCASLAVYSHKLKIKKPTPGKINRYCMASPSWRSKKYNF